MTQNQQSKIQLRAQILKKLEKIKQGINNKTLDAQAELVDFSTIKDYKTLSKIIINELKGDNSDYDYFLLQILTKSIGKDAEDYVFDAIMSDKIDDNKKLYLINVLKELNENANYSALVNSISNPLNNFYEEADEIEEDAIKTISSQIDFMDFYFASNDEDKDEILNTFIENSNKNDLINILSLLIYNKDERNIEYAIEKISKIKSYQSFLPLNYIIKNFKNKKYIALAHKAINELKLLGLRKEKTREEIYSEILYDSKPLNGWVSDIDGAFNFVLMFARENLNSTISFFATVLNLANGAVECFGFEDLERSEFREIAKNIYKKDKVTEIGAEKAANILTKITKNAIINDIEQCYELYAWQTLTCDIKEDENIEDEINNCLEYTNLKKEDIKSIIKYFDNWFINYGDNQAFDKLINEINQIKEIEKIEEIIKEKQGLILNKNIDDMLLYQSYFLKQNHKNELSKILNSIRKDEKTKKELKNLIIKKSIIIHYKNQKENLFIKTKNEILDIIEEKWQKEF
ncbi:MAG: hypothetical protein E7Z91_05910 [Cyanobacteria bacterium SIG30]|nr:hypothetical protein [Cyanobacteria bacterium SIG30]